MNKKILLIFKILAVSLILIACQSLTLNSQISNEPGAVQTAALQTVSALQTKSALETTIAGSTSVIQTATQASIDNTETPTSTPTNTAVPPTPTSPPPTATSIPCYRMQFIRDVTYSDGSVLEPNTTFTKTWRLQNSGSCTWTSDFDLVFVSGNSMGAPARMDINTTVAPGATVDISVAMTAPSSEGSYRGYFKLGAPNGTLFGWGPYGDKNFWADIRVDDDDTVMDSSAPLDFAYNYCNAHWYSAYGSLPCPGNSNEYTKGNVTRTSSPKLEGGYQDDETAIITVPSNGSGGYIEGRFPGIEVQNGDTFTAMIGCLYDHGNCNAMLQLNYSINGGAIQNLGSWTEVYEGSFNHISKDLSSLAGETVEFILTVRNNDGNSADDYIFWMVPKIVR